MTHTSTEQESSAFLPCPFCGGRSEFNEHDELCYFTKFAELKAKPASADLTPMLELFEAWNRRAPVNKQDHTERNLEMEVAKERTTRQAAQAEVAELKGRIARAGVEQLRAVREAVLQEREACAKACDGMEVNRDWVPGSLWGNIRGEMAAAIRARGEPEQPALPYHPAMMSEIINMADEIAICSSADSKEFDHDGLLRFAAMVQANEREACAQVCESQAGTASMFASSRDAKTHAAAAKSFAAAIRARP